MSCAETPLRWLGERRAENLAETGAECQYDRIIVLTIVIVLEGAVETREELDFWVDAYHHSRNLDKICQWLGKRLVNDDLYALRIVKMFVLASSAWGSMANSTKGFHSPSLSWITSIGSVSSASDAANISAHALRKQQRQNEIEQNKREARDWYDLERCLDSWIGKCPICYIRQKTGHNVDIYHELGICKDKQRDLVVTEIGKLRKIEFAQKICCKFCAVPREKCKDSMYYNQQAKEKCLYKGIVREAVATIITVGPDTVVDKMNTWMRNEDIWIRNTMLTEEEAQEITHMKLELFSQKASWRNYTASVLIQVFYQLDQLVEAFGKGKALEDWI